MIFSPLLWHSYERYVLLVFFGAAICICWLVWSSYFPLILRNMVRFFSPQLATFLNLFLKPIQSILNLFCKENKLSYTSMKGICLRTRNLEERRKKPSTWLDLKSRPQDHEACALPLSYNSCQPFQTCYECPLNKQTLWITNFCAFSEKAIFSRRQKKWKKKKKGNSKRSFNENKKSQNFESKNNFSLERKKNSATPFRCRLSSKKLSWNWLWLTLLQQ